MTRDEIIEQLATATEETQGEAIRRALAWAHKNETISDGPYDRAMKLVDAGGYIDAAMVLVPKGWHINCLATGDKGTRLNNPARFPRCILRPHLDNDDGWKCGLAVCERAATPALALAIAALKASDDAGLAE